MKRASSKLTNSALLAAFAACADGGVAVQALAPTPADFVGPAIVWEPDHRPLPDIPFPNDVGTRPDASSPTGRRINVSMQAPTAHERRLRRLINTMDGFGTYAPLWLRFADRIDLEHLFAVQHDADASNDAVYLIGVTPGSRDYGRAVQLDFGAGPNDHGATWFPWGLDVPDQYFDFDPRAGESNIAFETVDEDANANGNLDLGEDTDGDGVLDVPNTWGQILGDDRRNDGYRDLITGYELATDSLVFRPLLPLEQRATYAVVLTDELRDDQGRVVRSPFAGINHPQQTKALRPLERDGILNRLGVPLEQVAFAWAFTTQTTIDDLLAVREGLYGYGKLAHLHDAFPPQLSAVPKVMPDSEANPYLLRSVTLDEALNNDTILSVLNIPTASADALVQEYYAHVDYFVFGEFQSPSLMHPTDGNLRLDAHRGVADYTPETIYLGCVVPKETEDHRQPFPVGFYNHRSGSTRLEIIGYAPTFARHGIAMCAIDAYGHGMLDDDVIRTLVDGIVADTNLATLADVLLNGRARDLNGDGFKNSGGDYWTANLMHTRDAVRQSIVDKFQLVRVLRQMGQGTMPADVDGDGSRELNGDFDGDGVHDFGGEQEYFAMGQSLGGIGTAIQAALEPMLAAAAPVAGGAGLTDIAKRSMQPGMLEAVFLPLLGPIVTGSRNGPRYRFSIAGNDVITERSILFAQTTDVNPGDRARLENLNNGEVDELVIPDTDGFRLRVAADAGDRLRLTVWAAGVDEPVLQADSYQLDPDTFFAGNRIREGDPLTALNDGFGMRRQTPALRRLLDIGQLAVDAGDPANYVHLYQQPVEQRPDGTVPRNVLVVNSTGDMNVPVDTGVAMARIAGFVTPQQDQTLRDAWVLEGLENVQRFVDAPCNYDPGAVLFDIDDASEGTDVNQGPSLARPVQRPDCAADFPAPECTTCAAADPLRITVDNDWGQSGMRMMYLENTGSHTFLLPDPSQSFDAERYHMTQITKYFASRGQQIPDQLCMATLGACD